MLSRLFANVREVDPTQIPKEIKNSNFYLVPEPSLILTTPFIFKAGITRSSIIAEVRIMIDNFVHICLSNISPILI
jgi:hypothetical protein